MMAKTKVVLIGVNYNSDPSVFRFIEGLSKLSLDNVEFTCILVDNTERYKSDVFFNKVHAKNKHIVCIKAPYNLGYFGGARLGLSKYLEKDNYPDWLIISNVDIEFRDHQFLQILRTCSNFENIGVIAPSIWSEVRKHDWNPKIFARLSKQKVHFYKVLYRNFYAFTLYQLLSKLKNLINRSIMVGIKNLTTQKKKKKIVSWQNIYAPHGACIIFSKLYFERGGNLNYPQFLFGEEIFVAETVRHIGLRVIYYPAIKIYSYDHVSTGGRLFQSRKIASYYYESAVFIADKYFM